MKNNIKGFKIRKATAKDIKLITSIQKMDGFKHAYYLTSARLRELFKRGEIFFIAFINKEPVGFTSLYIETRARLHFLSVINKYAKMGIGSSLLEKIINETKKKKKNMIYVYTECGSPIEKFFIKKKFKKSGYFNNRFGKGKHANIFTFYL